MKRICHTFNTPPIFKSLKNIGALFLCCFLHSASLKAQINISGSLADAESGEPLIGGYLKLTTPSDTSTYFGVSDFEGNFSVEVLKEGDYTADISYIGYASLKKSFSINDNTDLGVITLSSGNTVLDEIKVTATQERASQKGDTTQYNASAYGANPNAAAEDLLQKMPGFAIEDGKMQVQGENITKILVNGKPFFGDDPEMALKNLPAEVISQIQVFEQSSESEEEEGNPGGDGPKTVNIILRKEYNNGKFGNFYGGYGDQGRYKTGANLNFFKGDRRVNLLGQFNNINRQNFSSADLLGISSAKGKGKKKRNGISSKNFLIPQKGGINTTNAGGINYQNFFGKKTEVSGSYFYNQSENVNETSLLNDFFNTPLPYSFEEESEDRSNNINHRINARFKHKIDPKNSIFIAPALTVQKNIGTSQSNAQTFSNDTLTNSLSDVFDTDLAAINFSNRLVFKHQFNKKKRAVNFTLRNNVNFSDGNTISQSTNINQTESDTSFLNQKSILDDSKKSNTAGIQFTEPIGKRATVSTGYTFGNEVNDSEILTFAFNSSSDDYDLPEENVSSVFDNNYLSHKGELTYRYRSRKQRFTLRGFFQSATLNNFQTFPKDATTGKVFKNFLPEVGFRHNFDKSKHIRLKFRTRTHLPKIIDLQDVVDNSNPLRIKAGNPDLTQQVSNNFDVRYSANNSGKGTVFFAFLKTSIYKDYIGTNLIIATQTDTLNGVVLRPGAQFRTPVNLQGYSNNRLFITYGMPLKILKSNFNINFGANHRRIPSQIDDETFFTNTEKLNTGLVLSSNISPEFDFTIKTSSIVNFSQPDNAANTKIFNQKTRATINYIFGGSWQLNSNITHQFYETFEEEPIEDFILWNASFGYKFLKKNRAELSLTLYDILNSNRAVNQSYGEGTYTRKESLALTRFMMLNFRYNIRSFTG